MGGAEIMAGDKDSRFTGGVFLKFCTARSIIPQSIIPCHHQNLGAAESRHGLSRAIIDHLVGNRKPNILGREEWDEFAAMTTVRLNSQVRKFGGFASGKRVSWRTPEMPIGTVGNPHF